MINIFDRSLAALYMAQQKLKFQLLVGILQRERSVGMINYNNNIMGDFELLTSCWLVLFSMLVLACWVILVQDQSSYLILWLLSFFAVY